MPRAFLLKRNCDKDAAVEAGHCLDNDVGHRSGLRERKESREYPSDDERYPDDSYPGDSYHMRPKVKMVAKPLKTFRVNPYGGSDRYNDDRLGESEYHDYIYHTESDAACRLCDVKGKDEREPGKKFSIARLTNQTISASPPNPDHPHHHHHHHSLLKKSRVSIMNAKISKPIARYMTSRSPTAHDMRRLDSNDLHRDISQEPHVPYKNTLWVDAERAGYAPSPYLTSPTHSYRSSETGSANSTGSGCNSYAGPKGHSSASSSPPDEYRYGSLCTKPCCRSYDNGGERLLDSNSDEKMAHARSVYNEKFLSCRAGASRTLPKEESCACAQCDVNREFLRRGSRYNESAVVEFNKNYSMIKPRQQEQQPKLQQQEQQQQQMRKRLSKRKALLNELEQENKRNKVSKTATVKPTQNPAYGSQTGTKNSTKDKTGSTDVLEIPPGPNRSRAVANLLERRRVAELNSSFETLRVLVPSYGNEDRSLSKIKTLKYAFTYIEHLMSVLAELNNNSDVDLDKDIVVRLCRKDPLIQKTRDHMKNNRKLF